MSCPFYIVIEPVLNYTASEPSENKIIVVMTLRFLPLLLILTPLICVPTYLTLWKPFESFFKSLLSLIDSVNFKKNEKTYDAEKSAVFKVLQEEQNDPEPGINNSRKLISHMLLNIIQV